MATWHQKKAIGVKLYHETQWTVVIDPPYSMRSLMSFGTAELARVYMRNLEANNPGAYSYAYILKPTTP